MFDSWSSFLESESKLKNSNKGKYDNVQEHAFNELFKERSYDEKRASRAYNNAYKKALENESTADYASKYASDAAEDI